MKHVLLRTSLLSLLGVSLLVAGCERSDLPGEAVVPQFAKSGPSSLHKAPGRHAPAEVPTAAAVIGPDGGSIELGGHRLTVPAGAVARPTRFSLQLLESGYVEVDLRASQRSKSGAEVSVGKQGFPTPVILELSYQHVEGVDRPDALVVAWVKPDGSLQPLRSTHDASARSIRAPLDHFSRFVLATP